jgi:hypothetical protein
LKAINVDTTAAIFIEIYGLDALATALKVASDHLASGQLGAATAMARVAALISETQSASESRLAVAIL